MYNYNYSIKKLKESQKKINQRTTQQHWLKHYHNYVQPHLLDHYDARVNAFIKRIEETPADPNKLIENPQSSRTRPFNFSLTSRSQTGKRLTTVNTFNDDQYKGSIWRQSAYIPLNHHEFRQRDKSKEIKPKSGRNFVLYKKMKEQRKSSFKRKQQKSKRNVQNENEEKTTAKKPRKDTYSDAHSFYDDNVSLKFSINSDAENIEKQAAQYQKKLEIVEKKSHYKRLANLQVLVRDPQAKKSIYGLLVKDGKLRAKIKTQKQEVETDMLKYIIEKGIKTQSS